MAQWVLSSQALRLENAERPGLVDYEEIRGFFPMPGTHMESACSSSGAKQSFLQ